MTEKPESKAGGALTDAIERAVAAGCDPECRGRCTKCPAEVLRQAFSTLTADVKRLEEEAESLAAECSRNLTRAVSAEARERGLQSECDQAHRGRAEWFDKATKAEAQRDAALEALKPFARFAQLADVTISGSAYFNSVQETITLTMADFEAAAKVVNAGPK